MAAARPVSGVFHDPQSVTSDLQASVKWAFFVNFIHLRYSWSPLYYNGDQRTLRYYARTLLPANDRWRSSARKQIHCHVNVKDCRYPIDQTSDLKPCAPTSSCTLWVVRLMKHCFKRTYKNQINKNTFTIVESKWWSFDRPRNVARKYESAIGL